MYLLSIMCRLKSAVSSYLASLAVVADDDERDDGAADKADERVVA